MGTTQEKALDKLHSTSVNQLYRLLSKLKLNSNESRLRHKKQHLDLSVDDHVIHAHLQHLEWQYGSIYRKYETHYFLFYNFNVNSSDLKTQHKDALKDFMHKIFIPQAEKISGNIDRNFEYFIYPYCFNLNDTTRQNIVGKQAWMPKSNASRKDVILDNIKDEYITDSTKPWWKNDGIGLADTTNTVKENVDNTFGTNGVHNNYNAFPIDQMLYYEIPKNSNNGFTAFTGHASDTGTTKINDPLSKNRANAITDEINTIFNAFYNQSLNLKISGTGSSNPILRVPGELETAENRSVQFNFNMVTDYIAIESTSRVNNIYNEVINEADSMLKNNITYLEEHINNNKSPFNLPHTYKTIESGIVNNDVVHALKNQCLLVAKNYKASFKALGNSPRVNNIIDDIHKIKVDYNPESKTDVLMMPMHFILGLGNKSNTYIKKPLSYKSRLNYAAKHFIKIRETYFDVFRALGESFNVVQKHSTLIERLYRDNGSNIAKQGSFLFTEQSKSEFEKITKDFTRKIVFDLTTLGKYYVNNRPLYTHKNYTDDNIEFNLSIFNEDLVNETVDLLKQKNLFKGRYFWFSNEVTNYQIRKKKKLIGNCLKHFQLTSQTVTPGLTWPDIDFQGTFVPFITYGNKGLAILSPKWILY